MLDIVGDHRVGPQLQVLDQQLVDAAIGLMRDEHVYLVGSHPGGVHRAPTDVAHFERCPTEDRGPFEPHKRAWAAGILGESDPVDVLPYGIGLFAVATRHGWSNALKRCLAHHHCGRAVGEDEAVAAVVHVYRGGQFFRADHQHRGRTSAPDHVGRCAKRISESGAPRRKIEPEYALGAQRRRDHWGGRRGLQEMGVGGDDHAIDVGRRQAGVRQCPSTGLSRHGSRRLVVGGESAGLDAGSGVDPLVGRVDVLAYLVVGDHAFGPVRPDTEQPDAPGAAGRGDLRHTRPICSRRVCTYGDDTPTEPALSARSKLAQLTKRQCPRHRQRPHQHGQPSVTQYRDQLAPAAPGSHRSGSAQRQRRGHQAHHTPRRGQH
ncbi:Uncharacterised protein [Mycobacterium tuberculosis]|nr:Uncharacterised protein [Mycobacterium tuberculosis]